MLLQKDQTIKVSDEIRLRPIVAEDAQLIFDATEENRAHLGKWLPWVALTTELEHTRNYIETISHESVYAGKFALAIEHAGDFAGIIDLHKGNAAFQSVEMGYWLRDSFTGKGIMRSCCAALIEFAFRESKLNRMTIKVPTGNYRSQELAHKLGFLKEGIEREGAFIGGDFVDINVNSMLRADWESTSIHRALQPVAVSK